MKKLTSLSAALVLATVTVATSTPALATPETYVVDGNHTFPRFSYSHFGFSTQLSRFNKTTGKIVLDKEAKTGSVDVVIDTKSVDTGSILDEHIQGEDFLDTAQYPTATFKSTQVIFKGDQPVAIKGNLTLKGVTKPVTLKVDHFNCGPNPMSKKEMCGADVSGTIKRSDWGMKYALPAISDEVRLFIAVEGYRQ